MTFNLCRNITLAYILIISRFSWFWLGIWVLYYLKFTNYTGIGLIETAMILSLTILEIPTGAVADLLGKKWTLFSSLLLQAAGGIVMAAAINLPTLLISVVLLSVGAALFSGTLEALVYDSLKQDNRENTYAKIITNISSLQLIVPALCGAIGGFMYAYNARLPYLANGITYFLGALLCIFITEPKIDTEKFSFTVFMNQQRHGFRVLFHTHVKRIVFLLLTVGAIALITTEVLDNMLSIEFGFRETKLGILWSLIYVASGLILQVPIQKLQEKSEIFLVLFFGAVIALSLLVSPYAGLWIGGFLLLIRSVVVSMLGNTTSVTINRFTESRYRATTLSSFNMVKSAPYLITALGMGIIADIYSARILGFGLGVLLVIVIIIWKLTDIKYATRTMAD